MVFGFPIELSSEIRKLVIEELHDMKMIEDDGGFRQMIHDCAYVGRRHIDGNGVNRCRRVTKPHPKRCECISSLTITDEYDGAAFEVENHGYIAMAFLDRNFIDGQISKILESRPGEFSLEVAFLDILNNIPRHMEMTGHIEYGHMLREVEDIPFKGSSIGKAGIGKAEIDLTDGIASSAGHPLDIEVQVDRFRSYGHHTESSRGTSPQNEISAPTYRAVKLIPFVFDGEDHRTSLIGCLHIGISDQTESVIQQGLWTCFPSDRDAWSLLFIGSYVHFLFKPKVSFERKNLS